MAPLTLGQSALGQEAAIRFENATEASGFSSLPNFGGHGIQLVDVDGDGWLDVYVTNIYNDQEDRPDLLFVNQRERELRFLERGVDLAVDDDGFHGDYSNESHAAIFADLDNDGDFDLFNARTWNGSNRLYRNEGGGSPFVDLSESAGLDVTDIGTRGVAAADFDKNGLLDVFVSAWQAAQPIIYWSSGGMHFDRERSTASTTGGLPRQNEAFRRSYRGKKPRCSSLPVWEGRSSGERTERDHRGSARHLPAGSN